MVQVVVIVPGATDFDEQERIQGDLDIPLSAGGEAEAGRLAGELQDLGLEVIYASACKSAQRTAQVIAAALGLKSKPLEELRNLNHGLWQGMLIDEVRLKQPTVYREWQERPEAVCPPEGETIASAKKRVQAVFSKLWKKHKQGIIAVVVPEPLASVVRSLLTGKDLGDLWQAEKAHGQWEVMSAGPVDAASPARSTT